jgi:hypothetical protein
MDQVEYSSGGVGKRRRSAAPNFQIHHTLLSEINMCRIRHRRKKRKDGLEVQRAIDKEVIKHQGRDELQGNREADHPTGRPEQNDN